MKPDVHDQIGSGKAQASEIEKLRSAGLPHQKNEKHRKNTPIDSAVTAIKQSTPKHQKKTAQVQTHSRWTWRESPVLMRHRSLPVPPCASAASQHRGPQPAVLRLSGRRGLNLVTELRTERNQNEKKNGIDSRCRIMMAFLQSQHHLRVSSWNILECGHYMSLPQSWARKALLH